MELTARMDLLHFHSDKGFLAQKAIYETITLIWSPETVHFEKDFVLKANLRIPLSSQPSPISFNSLATRVDVDTVPRHPQAATVDMRVRYSHPT